MTLPLMHVPPSLPRQGMFLAARRPGGNSAGTGFLTTRETLFARNGLETIRQFRAEAWTEQQKRLKRFWNEWGDKHLAHINADNQKRLAAECFLMPMH